ncbi:ABC transporter ATP-binding protein [Clostridium sediminicola]|uniref:ABC transporter ATP-binding protein n=1 Tax=Clostridium sediminicola TaxID=3114879 RepID=UPI0031F1DA4D
MLSVSNISKTYEKNKKKTIVLEGLNFDINNRDIFCIVGSSGCGKSTLLKILASLEKQTMGEIYLDNKIIKNPDLNRLIIFQDFNQLFPWKTIIQNITFPLNMNKIGNSRTEREEIAMKYLSMVGLDKFFNYYPSELSGGMKQRASIARALALKPLILLMDEPFASLDAQNRTALQELLLDIWDKTKTTIIFVTHDIQESILLSNKIMVMGNAPNSLKKIINNTLKRPRDVTSKEFSEIYNDIYNEIKNDSLVDS